MKNPLRKFRRGVGQAQKGHSHREKIEKTHMGEKAKKSSKKWPYVGESGVT